MVVDWWDKLVRQAGETSCPIGPAGDRRRIHGRISRSSEIIRAKSCYLKVCVHWIIHKILIKNILPVSLKYSEAIEGLHTMSRSSEPTWGLLYRNARGVSGATKRLEVVNVSIVVRMYIPAFKVSHNRIFRIPIPYLSVRISLKRIINKSLFTNNLLYLISS